MSSSNDVHNLSSASTKGNISNNHSSVKTLNKEENKSFLNVPHENLSISEFDIEQGFNRTCVCERMNRQNVLSVVSVVLALICIVFETFQMTKVIDNSREIDILKEELEPLRRQFYEAHDVVDQLNIFEKQLYSDELEDSSEDAEDDENEDYANYDDYESSDDLNDWAQSSSVAKFDLLKKLPIRSDEASVGSPNSSNGAFVSEQPHQISNNKTSDDDYLHSKRKKRFVNDDPPIAYTPDGRPIYKKDHQDHDEPVHMSFTKEKLLKKGQPSFLDIIPISFRFPPPSLAEHRRVYRKAPDLLQMSPEAQGSTRRHAKHARQTVAAHYGADSSLFQEDDEHSGNGKARHSEGIFKAWKPSEWMNDYGMNRYFGLAQDGKLSIHETGLYFIYAQIHYLDEHDENGFHLLVNGRPILQCMVYSPGTGHKSRSCFSSQVTFLRTGDRIVIKDVGLSRYTLFQRDKSFFGLVKLGDLRHAQLPDEST